MKIKKILIIFTIILLFPNFCYAETKTNFNLTDNISIIKINKKLENQSEESKDKEYYYYFTDSKMIPWLCNQLNGGCDFYYNESNKLEKFAFKNNPTIDGLITILKGSKCGDKGCYSYVKEDYCENLSSDKKVCKDIKKIIEESEKSEGINGFTCGGTDILKIIKFVNILLDIVLFIIPMALIIMISIDFAKNVMAGKDDEMKKNVNLAIKRIMFCAALFLINPLVSFVINFIGENSETYLNCIEIAESDDLWKYKIVWEYYPYEGIETQEEFKATCPLKDRNDKGCFIDYEIKDGEIRIWEDGTIEFPE